MDNFNSSDLAKMAMEIPQAGADALEITALVKDAGVVVGYQLSKGQMVNKAEAVFLARSGNIKGVGISERNGSEYLKSIPDATYSNNLGNLPSVSYDFK